MDFITAAFFSIVFANPLSCSEMQTGMVMPSHSSECHRSRQVLMASKSPEIPSIRLARCILCSVKSSPLSASIFLNRTDVTWTQAEKTGTRENLRCLKSFLFQQIQQELLVHSSSYVNCNSNGSVNHRVVAHQNQFLRCRSDHQRR